MKVLFFLSNTGYFNHFERVVELLSARGHDVEVLVQKVFRADRTGSPFSEWFAARGVKVGRPALTQDSWLVRVTRDVLNYNLYVSEGHPSRVRAEQWRRHLPRPARPFARTAIGRRIFASRTVRRTLRAVESRLPADPAIMQSLAARMPDVLFASACLVRGCAGPDYVRAARNLGIPSVVCPPSWDNLTTKTALHAIPDLLLVWNEILEDEATGLHCIPSENVFVTGAPGLDFWFEDETPADRDTFCRRVGLDPGAPYVMYLCSSDSISGNEAPFVSTLLSQLRKHPGLERLQFLIRPHPLSSSDWTGFKAPRTSISKEVRSAPSTREVRTHFRNSLHHALGVIAINTTGTLDAACMDKPCIAILPEQYGHSQMELAHFRILVDGGFLELGKNAAEVGAILLRLLDGVDQKFEARRDFVTRFVRTPFESHATASETVANVLEGVARGMSAGSLRSAFHRTRDLEPV